MPPFSHSSSPSSSSALQKLTLIVDAFSCPICHATLSAPVLLKCEHIYCSECIRRHLTTTSSCPQPHCKREATLHTLTPLRTLDIALESVRSSRCSPHEGIKASRNGAARTMGGAVGEEKRLAFLSKKDSGVKNRFVERLRRFGLPVTGGVDALAWRDKEFVIKWNANIDGGVKRSTEELVKEISHLERHMEKEARKSTQGNFFTAKKVVISKDKSTLNPFAPVLGDSVEVLIQKMRAAKEAKKETGARGGGTEVRRVDEGENFNSSVLPMPVPPSPPSIPSSPDNSEDLELSMRDLAEGGKRMDSITPDGKDRPMYDVVLDGNEADGNLQREGKRLLEAAEVVYVGTFSPPKKKLKEAPRAGTRSNGGKCLSTSGQEVPFREMPVTETIAPKHISSTQPIAPSRHFEIERNGEAAAGHAISRNLDKKTSPLLARNVAEETLQYPTQTTLTPNSSERQAQVFQSGQGGQSTLREPSSPFGGHVSTVSPMNRQEDYKKGGPQRVSAVMTEEQKRKYWRNYQNAKEKLLKLRERQRKQKFGQMRQPDI